MPDVLMARGIVAVPAAGSSKLAIELSACRMKPWPILSAVVNDTVVTLCRRTQLRAGKIVGVA
jgi:hypothetical protein